MSTITNHYLLFSELNKIADIRKEASKEKRFGDKKNVFLQLKKKAPKLLK
jgi:hypothetical protein